MKAEQMCLDSGIETVIARCFAFVGPWLPLDSHFAIGNFIGNCLRNEPIEIKGDGSPLRSYMYGLDLADWLMEILLNGCSGGVYNVGSDEAIAISDLAFKVRACAGTGSSILIQGTPDHCGLPSLYIPSIRKAKEELGLCLQFTLDAAIKQTLDWYRNQDQSS
jgi:nucleoside-diphosphate-sugar epimerase